MKAKLVGQFVHIGRPFFLSEARWRAFGMLALLIGLLLAVSGLNVVNSYVGRDFMTAISERQAAQYSRLVITYAGVFVASTLVAVAARYTEERFGLMWRRWLTRHLIDKYLSGRAYCRLNDVEVIDNPDQRISEDVKNFTVTTLSFILMILNSTITVFAFLGVLWSISPVLFLVALAYPALGTGMAFLLGHRLVGLDNLQLKKEANLRYELVRVREFAESIATVGSEAAERTTLRERVEDVVENFKEVILVNRNLNFFTTFYNYMIQLIPLMIAAPLFFQGRVAFGVVTQSAMAFSLVVNAFSLIVMQFQSIASFSAVITRLGMLWEELEQGAERADPSPAPDSDSDLDLDFDGQYADNLS